MCASCGRTSTVGIQSQATPTTQQRQCIVVPTTRELDQEEEEEKKLVKYFNQSGWKCLPPGLPYVEGGKIYALNAQAMKEVEKLKLAADKDFEFL